MNRIFLGKGIIGLAFNDVIGDDIDSLKKEYEEKGVFLSFENNELNDIRVRYHQVACSLDGYIAGPNDEFDWITPEPSFDFEALFAQFDTLLVGRRTYEIVRASYESLHG